MLYKQTIEVVTFYVNEMECLMMQYLITHLIPEIKQGYPLNLSISVSGGKETN